MDGGPVGHSSAPSPGRSRGDSSRGGRRVAGAGERVGSQLALCSTAAAMPPASGGTASSQRVDTHSGNGGRVSGLWPTVASVSDSSAGGWPSGRTRGRSRPAPVTQGSGIARAILPSGGRGLSRNVGQVSHSLNGKPRHRGGVGRSRLTRCRRERTPSRILRSEDRSHGAGRLVIPPSASRGRRVAVRATSTKPAPTSGRGATCGGTTVSVRS